MKVRIVTNPRGITELKKVSAKYIDTVADKIEAKAKEICPVATGKLQKSIHVEDGDSNSKLVGSEVDYSLIVELRQPYLRPALDVVMAQVRG